MDELIKDMYEDMEALADMLPPGVWRERLARTWRLAQRPDMADVIRRWMVDHGYNERS